MALLTSLWFRCSRVGLWWYSLCEAGWCGSLCCTWCISKNQSRFWALACLKSVRVVWEGSAVLCTYWPLGDVIRPFMRRYWSRLLAYPVMRETTYTAWTNQRQSCDAVRSLKTTFLYFTWDPGGTQSRNVCLCRLTGECWNALATSPTQPEYSTSKSEADGVRPAHSWRGFRKLIKLGVCADRAFFFWGLDTARAIVAHAAGRVAFDGSLFPDKIMHLLVLPHAWRVFGPQVDQRLLIHGKWSVYYFHMIIAPRKTSQRKDKRSLPNPVRSRSSPAVQTSHFHTPLCFLKPKTEDIQIISLNTLN